MNSKELIRKYREKNHYENNKLCSENLGAFMLCPRCNGTRFIKLNETMWEPCTYCDGSGVITWIDKIIRGKRIPE